jgi:predicted RNA-binding Zn ribbon-like protein
VAPTDAFPLLGEPPAVDLVNTEWVAGGTPVDGLATAAGLREWLRLQGAAGGLGSIGSTVPRLGDVWVLRMALRSLFDAGLQGGPVPAGAVAVVNRFSAAGASYPELVWPAGGVPTASLAQVAGDSGAAVLAAIARSGIDVLTGDGRGRLRRCEGPGCVLYFVAANARRRWCSPRLCGNRVRVARHYQRRRSARGR